MIQKLVGIFRVISRAPLIKSGSKKR